MCRQPVPSVDTRFCSKTASTGAVALSGSRAQGLDVQLGLTHCSHGLHGWRAAPHRYGVGCCVLTSGVMSQETVMCSRMQESTLAVPTNPCTHGLHGWGAAPHRCVTACVDTGPALGFSKPSVSRAVTVCGVWVEGGDTGLRVKQE